MQLERVDAEQQVFAEVAGRDHLSRWRCVAQTTRTSTLMLLLSPTRRISRLSSTRSSLACIDLGSSPISSRNSVPPSATSNSPTRCSSAPVKAPLRWPKSSLSIRFSGKAPQLIATNGCSRRRLCSCSERATSSLPVPVSPRISTVLFGRRDLGDQLPHALHRPASRRSSCVLPSQPLELPLAAARYLLFSSRLSATRCSSASELGQLARLGQVVERAVAQRGDRRLERRLAREHHGRRYRAKLLGSRDHLDAGRGPACRDRRSGSRRLLRSSAATAVSAVGTDGHLVPEARQLEAHQLLQRAFVVGEQQLQRLGGLVAMARSPLLSAVSRGERQSDAELRSASRTFAVWHQSARRDRRRCDT